MEVDKYMTSKVIKDDEWMTLKEASVASGRTINSLRLLISRKKIDKVKKMHDNGPGYWLIHREAMSQISMSDMGDKDTHHVIMSDTHQPIMSAPCQVISMPVEYYTQQQKERDELVQGLMMYRYKFEELDRQMRLLPAPVENIPAKLSELETKAAELAEKDQVLRESQDAIRDLETKAAEKDQSLVRSQETINALEEALHREKQRSWWDRLWKR